MNRNDEPRESAGLDPFDRQMWALRDLPGGAHTRATTLVIGSEEHIGTDTFIIQTYRQPEIGDIIFLQHVTAGKLPARIVIPPRVADLIARQRDQLSKTVRSKSAKKAAQERMSRGEVPAFLKKKTK